MPPFAISSSRAWQQDVVVKKTHDIWSGVATLLTVTERETPMKSTNDVLPSTSSILIGRPFKKGERAFITNFPNYVLYPTCLLT